MQEQVDDRCGGKPVLAREPHRVDPDHGVVGCRADEDAERVAHLRCNARDGSQRPELLGKQLLVHRAEARILDRVRQAPIAVDHAATLT